ncbi:MAG: hypothetical protein QOF84_983 [Streptomyces sp.]|jgi:hypothetical protein|nr:hypothetical protein [Streptomyces sp.]
MLSMNTYGREYIDDCRAKIEGQVAAYRETAAAGAALGGEGKARYDAAAEAFEPVFFNNMVQVLDNYFVHRSRTLEKKDGNALNEVRVLCTSMTSNDGRLAADKQIRLNPEKSVLGYKAGDVIALRENHFQLLAKAFFAEIEAKFL